jgi:tetratricopeptide (TPR) repeat protein
LTSAIGRLTGQFNPKLLPLLAFPLLLLWLCQPTTASRLQLMQARGLLWQQSLAWEEKGDGRAALLSLQAYAARGGDPYLVNLRAGWLNLQQKRYSDAANYYQQASRFHPQALAAHVGLLQARMSAKQYGEAGKLAAIILKTDPVNYQALVALASLSYDQQSYGAANRYYRALLRYYPDDLAAMSGAGWSALRLGIRGEAVQCFERLVALQPGYPKAAEGFRLASGG